MSGPTVSGRHRWTRVGWADGYSVQRCACGAERTPRVVRRGAFANQATSGWRYRRQGESAWGDEGLPCPVSPAPTTAPTVVSA